MTIPIRPGAFSFLEKFGQAGGAAFASAEQDRQRKLKEAQDQARNYLALRAAGLMKPKDFEKPEIQAVFQAAGFGPVSSEPTSAESNEQTRRDFAQPERPGFNLPISSMITGGIDQEIKPTGPSTISDERRLAAGLPKRSEVLGEKAETGIQATRVGAIEQGGPRGRVVTGVPSESVATAAESGPVRQAFEAEAPGFVALATRGARLENVSPEQFNAYVDTAYEAYLQDAKQNKQAVLPEAQARRYFANALDNAIREAEGRQIQRIAAGARFASSDPELRDVDRQVDNLRYQVSNARQRMQTALSSLPSGMTVGLIESDEGLMQIYGDLVNQIRNEQAVIEVGERQLNELQSRYSRGLDARYPGREQGNLQPLVENRRLYDDAEAWLRAGNVDPKQPRQPGESIEQYIRRVLGTRP